MDFEKELLPGENEFDFLVRWLSLDDRQKNQFAITVLCRLGLRFAPPLILAAIRDGKPPRHRIAILDVVQQIGGPLGLNELMNLQSLLRHRSLGVRSKAAQVIMAVGPCGLPKTPEDLASDLALNPFLQPLPSRRGHRKRRKTFAERVATQSRKSPLGFVSRDRLGG